MLEWVNDTSTLRSLIIESHTQLSDPREFPLPDMQTFHVEFQQLQADSARDIGALINMYNKFVGSYRPCLHRWFLDKFQVEATTDGAMDRFPLFSITRFVFMCFVFITFVRYACGCI